MTKILFLLLTLALFGCKEAWHKVDSVETVNGDTTSIEHVIRQVRQQTLLYLDTIIDNDRKKLVRFHPQLDSSTFQTLQNWIFHNEKKIQLDEKEVLNLLNKSHVDSLLLIQFDTALLTSTFNADKVTQIHFNGFAFSFDTTKVATVVGVYFGDESERITGWREFLVFIRQGSGYAISKRAIVTEY